MIRIQTRAYRSLWVALASVRTRGLQQSVPINIEMMLNPVEKVETAREDEDSEQSAGIGAGLRCAYVERHHQPLCPGCVL